MLQAAPTDVEQELMQPEQWLETVSDTWDVSPYMWCMSQTRGKVSSVHLGILGWVLWNRTGWSEVGWVHIPQQG